MENKNNESLNINHEANNYDSENDDYSQCIENNNDEINIKKNKLEKNFKIVNFRLNYWFHVLSMKKHYPSKIIYFDKNLKDFYKMDEDNQIEIIDQKIHKYYYINDKLYNNNKNEEYFNEFMYLYKINKNIIKIADIELGIY